MSGGGFTLSPIRAQHPGAGRGSDNRGFAVSALDIKALETNFGGWRTERAPDMSVSDAFERYTAELVLAEADLSDEDVTSGLVGGGDDGGIDGFYFLSIADL